jgi:hypothetical protein
VDGGPELLEQVHQPVVAVGRLQNHLGVRPSRLDGTRHFERLVRHPHGGQVLTLTVHPDDDRAAAVQVDADILSFRHVGSSSSRLPFLGNRECACTRNGTSG